MTDPVYHCMDCNGNFLVRAFIDRDIKKTGRKAHCPHCSSLNTGNARTMNRQPATARSFPSSDTDPPTAAQLSYIQGLGGNAEKITTKKEAGEYIGRLKKLKESA